jgi:hypothetical protein
MRFTLELDMDNAAFDDDESYELAAILERITEKVRTDWGSRLITGPVLDTNGNTVGRLEITEYDGA